MFGDNSQSTQRLNLREIAATGFRHRRLVTLCSVGIVVGAIIAALALPKYEAETKLLVNRRRVDPVIAPLPEQNNPIANYELTTEELNSEVELLNSYEMERAVVVACDLQHPKTLFGKIVEGVLTIGLDDNEKIDRAVSKLDKAIDVEAVPKTNVIKITYDSRDAGSAAHVLDTLNQLYIAKHREVHRSSGQLTFFSQQTEDYKNKLAESEAKLGNFPTQYGTVTPDLDRDATLQKLNEFSANLQQTLAAKQETENRINSLTQQASSTSSRLTTQIRSADNPQLLQQLKGTLLNLELKRVELLAKFKPDYRPVKETEKQISDTLAAIDAENKRPLKDETTDVNPTYQWVVSEFAKARTELSGLDARSTALSRIVSMYQAKVRDLDKKNLIYQDLVRTAKADEANYLLYLRKQEESRITDALDDKQIINVAIAEKPLPPALPTHSPLFYGVVGAAFAGFLSLGLIFTLEYLDTSFRTPREVEEMLHVPVLASVPYQGNGGRSRRSKDPEHTSIAV